MSKVKDKIEIIIADDHMMIREGLKQLLELDGTMKVIAEANDGEECLNLLNKKIHPDILLLDINMPKKNGIEVLEYIKQNKIPVKVLILTVHNEVEYLLKAVDIGIDGYLLKDSSYDELKEAIDVVISGNTYIQPSLLPALNESMEDYALSKYLYYVVYQLLFILTYLISNSEYCSLCSIFHIYFSKYMGNMIFYCSFTDCQLIRYFLIATSF